MRRRSSSAATLRRRSVTALSAALVVALLGGTTPAIAAPQRVPVVQQQAAVNNEPPADPVDEEYEFYKQLVQDIAEHAEDVEVRDAAKAALAVNTKEKLVWFLDHGRAEAQARADQRKAVENAANRKKVEEWARTGGPNVKAGAQAALSSGDRAIRNFVLYGYEIELKKDQQQAEDDKAEQDRIIARVRSMVEMGGPQVQLEGEAILASNDYAQIREFYLTGYHAANQRDHQYEQVILKALEDRNRAIAELEQLAKRSAAAASARAEILRANIDQVKHLEDVLYAMQRAVKAAHRADEIFREDKPGRAHGQLGRNGDIDVQRAIAANNAVQADQVADRAAVTTQQVRNAAERLVDTGLTNGLDWAKVTIGIGDAIEAAAAAALTSAHAVEATLADSRALDADRNAQEHANNAAKYRAEAERQATRAAELAEAAKKQLEIATAARNEAARQRDIARQKANEAKSHATKARNARASAQSAAANAAAKAQAAFAANAAAADAGRKYDASMKEVSRTQTLVNLSTQMYNARLINADRLHEDLIGQEAYARQHGLDVEEHTREIRARATEARGHANEAQAWAGRAQAAAATARSEAQKAETAARQARAAAAEAQNQAVIARRAADEAHRLTMEAMNAAAEAKHNAEMTQAEAEAAVREANQAVFQSVVADRAAAAASASAAMSVDSARSAELILKPFAAINADARRALEVTSQAIRISEEQSRLAREKATEAADAAVRARKAADGALEQVKPAWEAAIRAADSANLAAKYALDANNVANEATQNAKDAYSAAGTATSFANTARQDAMAAGNAAAMASASAASANQAAAATERMADIAEDGLNKIQLWLDSVVQRIDDIHEHRVRMDMAEQIAREEAEAKARELNEDFAKGLAWVIVCKGPNGPAGADERIKAFCERGMNKVKEIANQAIDAVKDGTREMMHVVALCAGGDENACQRLKDGQTALQQFQKSIFDGIVEGGKGMIEGFKVIAGCLTAEVFYDNACDKIVEGWEHLKNNPHVLIHLEEWQTNPGKALGLTFFDLGSMLAGVGVGRGTGSAVFKGISIVGKGIGKGIGKMVRGTGFLDSLTVKIADNIPTRLPHALGEVFNLEVRMDAGMAKIDGAVVDIDGQLYRVQRLDIHPDGNISQLEGAILRLSADRVTIDNGLAKLEGAKLKVEEPKSPDDFQEGYTDPKTGVYTAKENGVAIRLEKHENDAAETLLKQAADAKDAVSGTVESLKHNIPGSYTEGWEKRLKDPASLKRKLYDTLHPKDPDGNPLPSPPLDVAMRELNDSLRYTLVFPKETYTLDVLDGLRRLDRNPDIRITVLKNKWNSPDGRYKGINMTLETSTGLQWELQFHTPMSYLTKTAEHSIFSQKRFAKSKAEADALDEQSKKIFGYSDADIPDGAKEIPQRGR